ncbi:SpaA isopeptide-forming pilin-related protein [uncultured Solobacterium sp.]|uniref:SpaA isopeptide-forming pilin-related protein n=1 Tax=uncultured Solobacterium sp. TaxID=747375 RepID=UPI0028ECD8B4|nr:SpaA isopeptide-forming pilin-related protein [uncultured Solobacterium sp.]
MNLLNQMKRKAIKLLSVMAAFILALVIPMGIKLLPVEASTVNLDTLEVGDTFSGKLGTSNTNPSTGVTNFTIDYIDGLLGGASGQIINQLSVQCLEPGHIGLTYKTAYESGSKTYYPYNATVTDVQPDGRVTLRINVPRYLNPYTGEEATGWSAGLGTVPYQRCGATWVIQTAPRNISVNVTLDKSNGNPAMTQGNAACYAQDLSGAIYGVYSDAALTNEVGRITTDATGHGELNGITVQRNAVLYTKELVAPRGFGLDAQVYSHMFTANGETYSIQSTDVPLNDPLTITLNKISADGTVVANPASLEGAEFTIKYYAGQYTFNDLPTTATRTWVIQTKLVGGRYFALMSDTYKVSGDPFYLDAGIPTLPLGTITVEETKAPEGYTLDNKVIDATNSPAPNVKDGVALFNIVDENSLARVVGGNEYTVVEGVVRGGLEIQKKDADTGANVGTATFEIVNKNNYDVVARDENGDVVATAAAGQTLPYTITTDANGYWKSNDAFLPAGDYELVEVSAPAGYYLNTNPKPFEIKDNGTVVSLDYADDKIVIDVAKTDGKGNNVAGAKMTLIDKVTGSEIVTFTSTKENTDISKYVEGGKTYILREDEAPFGFNKFENIEFTVTGTRQHEQVVMAVDTRKVFYVSAIKVDAMDNSKKLKGAELTLFKADGTVAVDKDGNPCVGITDGEGVITWAVEFADDLGGYYVQETAAPEGYRINHDHFQVVLSEDYDFAVNNAVKVVVNDMALPSVKTGDTFNAVGLSMMFVGGLAVAVFLFLKKKQFAE